MCIKLCFLVSYLYENRREFAAMADFAIGIVIVVYFSVACSCSVRVYIDTNAAAIKNIIYLQIFSFFHGYTSTECNKKPNETNVL